MTSSAAALRPSGGASIARAVATSTGTQLAAKIIHLGLNVVSSLVLIRSMAPAAYGEYVLVFTVIILVGLLSDFGLDKVAVREIVRDEAAEPAVLGTLIAARLGLAALAAGLVQAVLLAMDAGAHIHGAAAIASLLLLGEAMLAIVVVFHVRLKQQHEALVRVVGEAVETALVIWLVSRGAPLAQLVAAPVAGVAVGVAMALWIARRRFAIRVRFEWRRLRPLLRTALVVGPAMLAGVAYLRLDSVLLGALRPAREVGIYGGAFQPIEYLLLGSAVLINVLYPVLARLHGRDRTGFDAAYRRGSELLLALVLPVPVLLSLVAPPMVTTVYGADFAASAGPLQLLACGLVFMVVSVWHGFILLATGHQRVMLIYNVAALAVSVALNVVLITSFGYIGAALATLATAAFAMTWSTVATVRRIGTRPDLRRVARVVLTNLLMAATLWTAAAAGVTWWLAATAAALSYPLWVWLFGVVTAADLRSLRSTGVGAPPAPTETGWSA